MDVGHCTKDRKDFERRESKIMTIDIGRLLDNVIEKYDSLLLLVSIFLVK